MIHRTLLALALSAGCSSAGAATLTHSASSFPGSISENFGPLGQPVSTAFVAAGVDYTFGNVEGVFNDPPYSLCGINLGICDLLTTVDGRIVVANSLTQGLTNFIYAEAGFAPNDTLLLRVFDQAGTLITSAANSDAIVGPTGRSTFSIDRGGVFDIAFFSISSISGTVAFGVTTVEIGDPVAVEAVPLPASLPLFVLAFAILGFAARRRRCS